MDKGRRAFVAAIGGAIAWPAAALAQQAKVPLIGFLRRTGPVPAEFAAFRDGLKVLGYEDGRTIRIEQRYAGGDLDRLRALAGELARMNVSLFVVDGTATAEAVRTAAPTTPVVAAILSPERLGILNVNRPGGNITGLSALLDDLYAKRLELLKEVVPQARLVAVLRNPRNVSPIGTRVLAETASRLGLSLRTFDTAEVGEWPAAIAAIAKDRCDAVLQVADATFYNRPADLVALTLARRLPAVYPERVFVDAGGLLSYGVDYADHWRRAASYADRILKGMPAGELAIEQPSKFELVINVKTARSLGLTVAPPLLARADHVVR